MATDNAPAPTIPSDARPPAEPAPAPALPHPTATERTATVVQVACLFLAVLMFLVAGTFVAGALVRSWGAEVPKIEVAEKPDDYFKVSLQLQAYQNRRQSQLDQRTAALTSGGFLTGVATAFLSVSLLLGALRPEPVTPPAAPAGPKPASPPPAADAKDAARPAANTKSDPPPTPTPVQRLVALIPGVVALVGAIVLITASMPHTPPTQGQPPYGIGFAPPAVQVPSPGFQ